MSRIAWVLLLGACGQSPEEAVNDGVPPELEVCADGWPSGCRDGCDASQDQLWADAYMAVLEDAWSLSREEVEAHIAVLEVADDGSMVRVYAELRSGWVSMQYEALAVYDASPTTIDAAVQAFLPRASVPQLDPTTPPRPWAEIEAAVDACGEELGVTFEGWCRTYITLDPLDDDQAGVRFDFEVPLSEYDFASFSLYAWGSEPDFCIQNSYVF